MNDVTYIHYGSKKFDPNRVRPIENEEYWTKPEGGLWASPVDADYGWYDWCRRENFDYRSLDVWFTFKLKEDTKILYLRCKEDLMSIPSKYILRWNCNPDHVVPATLYLDFEKLDEDGYQAIVYEHNVYTHYAFNCWDCDSIVVLDPTVITLVEEGGEIYDDT